MAKQPITVTAYKCSDGYLTESLNAYKRREKVLKKPKDVLTQYRLNDAMLSDEEYKSRLEQTIIDTRFRLWRDEHPCKRCNGKGKFTETDSGYGADRYYDVKCTACNETGLRPEALERYTNGTWYKEAKKIKVDIKELPPQIKW